MLKISNLTNIFQMGWNHQPGKDRLSSPTIETQEPSALKLQNFKVMLGEENGSRCTHVAMWLKRPVRFFTYIYIYIYILYSMWIEGVKNHGVYMFISPGSLRKPGIWKQKKRKKNMMFCNVFIPRWTSVSVSLKRIQWINCTTGFQFSLLNHLLEYPQMSLRRCGSKTSFWILGP